MARCSRKVSCARMGHTIARRSTGNFSAARYAHFLWNIIGSILIVRVHFKTLTKGGTYDSEQVY
jgi:hypothetical protein